MTPSLPILMLLALLPLLGGALLLRIRSAGTARRVAVAFTAATLAGALGLVAWYYRSVGGGVLSWVLRLGLWGTPRPVLALDALSAPLLPFVALVSLAVALGAPRRESSPRALAALLFTQGLTLALFLCVDLGVLAMLWGASLLPAYWLIQHDAAPDASREHRPRLRRTFQIYGTLTMLPVLAAVVLLALGRGTPAPLSLLAPVIPGRGGPELAAALLLCTGVIARSALFPLASLLPEIVERAPLAAGLPLCVTQPGAYLLARVVLPLFPQVGRTMFLGIAALGLLTAALAALIGLGQRSLRGLAGWLAVSQSGLLLAGLCAGDHEAAAGALLQWIAAGLGLTGILLAIAATEARAGTTELSALGGMAPRAPRLATAFLLFGIACIGIPGSLGFIAEDLLVHGLLETSPLIAGAAVIVTALNGIAVLRAYARAFLGPPSLALPELPGRSLDLRRREQLVVLLLLAPLCLGGLFPSGLVRRIGQAAERARPAAVTEMSHWAP